MALQDLTPQLRTRLSRMERAVGWFLLLATVLLLTGFGYYIYSSAKSKGWFLKKIDYQTSIGSGAGLKVGQPVKLMGFDVGEITDIQPNGPYEYYNITVEFRIKEPYYGYVWSDSTVKVAAGDFLGNRYLEVTKGLIGVPTVLDDTNKIPVAMLRRHYLKERIDELSKQFTNKPDLYKALNADAANNQTNYYTNLTKKSIYWLEPDEAPALTERAQQLVSKVEAALPGILALTNQIATVLSNSTFLTSNLNDVAENFRPTVTNLSIITGQLRNPEGSLGEWIIPTNLNQQLGTTLQNANGTLDNLNTNLFTLNRSLDNLAGITSNLNNQVQANSNILSNISDAVVHSDQFVQGLKRFWLFRHLFKTSKTNAPPAQPRIGK
jgi:ABC-type transporter Mla subunit MlaD